MPDDVVGRGPFALEIPDFYPTSDNILINSHWSVASKLKKADAEVIGVYFKLSRIPEAAGKRLVEAYFAGSRIDPSNHLKSLGDALVKCGALVDDSSEWVEWRASGRKSRTRWNGTSITITEIPSDE